jgi:hypothetical protein
MAASQNDDDEKVDSRFSRLLDEALANPPEETTTREQLAASKAKLIQCMEAGLSRRLLHGQYLRAGGLVSYQRFCVLLKEVVLDDALVGRIRGKYKKKEARGSAKEGGSRLLAERRRGGPGKTIEEIRTERTAALVEAANFEQHE